MFPRAAFYFVFDVESVGLHGEPFAVGFTVRSGVDGEEVYAERIVLPFNPDHLQLHNGRVPTRADIAWVKEHVVPATSDHINELTPTGMLRKFWLEWKRWESHGAVMAADVPWPVEARFLMECACWAFNVNGKPTIQEGPYPILDIATLRFAAGFDPVATESRNGVAERPVHDPLADARQSARLMFEAFELLEKNADRAWRYEDLNK